MYPGLVSCAIPIYPFVRRALNLLRPSFSTIFQYFSAVIECNVTRTRVPGFFFSGISIFRNLCMYNICMYTYVCHAPWNCIVGHGFFDLEFVGHGFVSHT